jgi:glycine dehydrogenase
MVLTKDNAMANLPYDINNSSRELKPFYISADENDLTAMMQECNVSEMTELFNHIPKNVMMDELKLPAPIEYHALIKHMEELAAKNSPKTSFIGRGLPHWSNTEITPYLCSLRGLTTAYTPYQPERSQGTLYTLWLYSCAMKTLTGFEAINASLYERSTALYEATQTAARIKRKPGKHIILESILPKDREVLDTLAMETETEFVVVPFDKTTGTTSAAALKEAIASNPDVISLSLPQTNGLGCLEDVHGLTNLAHESGLLVIGIIDPFLLASKGLVKPVHWGDAGADMIVGEAQHLATAPTFGGPGLGLFGIRFNEKNKTAIRSTPGRYVGKTVDENGKQALCMVLSTREQHIRREKATSNICSNQSFLATLVGASAYERGDRGLSESIERAVAIKNNVLAQILNCAGVELAFSGDHLTDVALKTSKDATELIEAARQNGLHIGPALNDHTADKNTLMISFSDRHDSGHESALIQFFVDQFGKGEANTNYNPEIEGPLKAKEAGTLEQFDLATLKSFYDGCNELNLSPDDAIYPLGSCTMKYNPYINDYAAGLSGFTDLHPECPLTDAQGNLQLLFETQEMFSAITGLPAVVTQPVAGAQGELVGLKMFQAYHADKGEAQQRDTILIPRSAHGTNPATATMAGYVKKARKGSGIITLNALENGRIDIEELKTVIAEHGPHIAGIMVTNPNTAGIFETQFKEMADLIHAAGGLVYMDGANMNAIAGHVDLDKLGVDAVHNNLHKTWTIPHGGGGPGDAIVAVSSRLIDFIPGIQVKKEGDTYEAFRPAKSIGSFHRHFGNFGHKVRAYTYVKSLGDEGVKKMSAVATLSANYLYHKLRQTYPTLPANAETTDRLHEFIITLSAESFEQIEKTGIPKAQIIARIGKLFLDFGLHAPTVAFPEVLGLMIEPTESFTKDELDHFIDVVKGIHHLVHEHPEVLTTAPHFAPVRKVDEVSANKNLVLFEAINQLPELPKNPVNPKELCKEEVSKILTKIVKAHQDLS